MVSQYSNQPTRSCLDEFFVVNICKITVQRICFEKGRQDRLQSA